MAPLPASEMMERCVLLCTTGDNREFFERGLLVTLRSLRRTNPSLPVVVFYDRLDADQRRALAGCQLRAVDPAPFDASHRPDLSRATFFRFYLGHELGEVDRILYLDTDLVVLDELDELFQAPDPVVAVAKVPPDPDLEIVDARRVAREEGLDSLGPVFNAGVVCFDGPFWRRHRLLERALEIAVRHGWDAFPNCDQGILNLLAAGVGGWHPVGPRFNFWPAVNRRARIRRNRFGLWAPVIGDRLAAIVHWAGPAKPWKSRPNTLQRLVPALNRVTADGCYHQFAERAPRKGSRLGIG